MLRYAFVSARLTMNAGAPVRTSAVSVHAVDGPVVTHRNWCRPACVVIRSYLYFPTEVFVTAGVVVVPSGSVTVSTIPDGLTSVPPSSGGAVKTSIDVVHV